MHTTKDEKQAIYELYQKEHKLSDIALKFNKHVATIIRIVRKKEPIVNNRLTESQKNMILFLFQEKTNISAIEIASHVNKNPATIRRFLAKNNIDISKRRHRKYFFDERKFQIIDNEEKAYWLGFLTGDGCVRNYNLCIELSQIDKLHLNKFLKFMNANYKITNTKKNCCKVNLCSIDLISDLSKYNIIINKTHKSKTPKIEEKYLASFYRGILDSDGWICKHSSKNPNHKQQHEFGFSSACKNFLEEIQAWISSKLNTTKCGYLKEIQRKNKHKVCQLIIGGNKNFVKLHELFYKDANIYLDRKYEKIQGFIKTIS